MQASHIVVGKIEDGGYCRSLLLNVELVGLDQIYDHSDFSFNPPIRSMSMLWNRSELSFS